MQVDEIIRRQVAERAKAKPAPAAPAVRQSPIKTMSEADRQSRARTAELFARWDQMKALAAEYGEPDYDVAIDFAQRGVSLDDARREFARRASLRGWARAFAETGGPMH